MPLFTVLKWFNSLYISYRLVSQIITLKSSINMNISKWRPFWGEARSIWAQEQKSRTEWRILLALNLLRCVCSVPDRGITGSDRETPNKLFAFMRREILQDCETVQILDFRLSKHEMMPARQITTELYVIVSLRWMEKEKARCSEKFSF